MGISREQFELALVAANLMSPDDIKDFLAAFPAADAPPTSEALAHRLVKAQKITRFQATQLLAGRPASLLLGDYILLERIGAGGMGQVFKARHRHMKRVVALKVISAQAMKDAAAIKRFQREVEAAAKLEHPNVVAAFDCRYERGICYLVMAYIEGRDLAAVVKEQGPLPVELAMNCVLQAARGLAYAHGEGVVHRDIKPANLLLDKKGVVKVLDMGLARLSDNSHDNLTATEQVMGTVDYMSPEQAASTHDVDARTDVYSLGCTLWYLLTGHRIYDGDTLMSRMLKHREATIPSLREARPDAPAGLDAIYRKMVAKHVEDRLQTMDEVVRELEALLITLVGPATDQTSAERAKAALGLENISQKRLSSGSTSSTPHSQVAVPITAGSAPTIAFNQAQVETDPESEVSVAPLKKGADGGGRKPPLKRIALGGAGFVAVCLAVWIILRNDKGEEVGRLAVEVPKGGSIEVRDAKSEPAAPATSAKTRAETIAVASPAAASAAAPKPITTFKDPAFQQWVKDVAALPAEEQVRAVIKKLKELNPGYDSPVTHRIEKGIVTRLQVILDHDADVSPVRALPRLKDLSFVGTKGKFVRLDLSPLEGIALTALDCSTYLTVSDLSPLHGMPLTSFAVSSQKIDDLSPLKGMPLIFLRCDSSHVSDLSPLAGMPLKALLCYLTRVSDLSPLAGCDQLRLVDVQGTQVAAAGVTAFQNALPHCKVVWGQYAKPTISAPAKAVETIPAFAEAEFQKWQKDVAGLAPEEQIKAVVNKLQDLNPGFDGHETHKIENSIVTSLRFTLTNEADISPVRALPGLKELSFEGGVARPYPLDLSALQGMSLTSLNCYFGQVSDLSPLRGMPLTFLQCGNWQLSDLSPLQGMPLNHIHVSSSQVSDLSPLRGMALKALSCRRSFVADLSPLAGMPLLELVCEYTPVSDLSPLETCGSLKHLYVGKTKVTATGVAALQKALPNCKIEWDDADATPAQSTNSN